MLLYFLIQQDVGCGFVRQIIIDFIISDLSLSYVLFIWVFTIKGVDFIKGLYHNLLMIVCILLLTVFMLCIIFICVC